MRQTQLFQHPVFIHQKNVTLQTPQSIIPKITNMPNQAVHKAPRVIDVVDNEAEIKAQRLKEIKKQLKEMMEKPQELIQEAACIERWISVQPPPLDTI